MGLQNTEIISTNVTNYEFKMMKSFIIKVSEVNKCFIMFTGTTPLECALICHPISENLYVALCQNSQQLL